MFNRIRLIGRWNWILNVHLGIGLKFEPRKPQEAQAQPRNVVLVYLKVGKTSCKLATDEIVALQIQYLQTFIVCAIQHMQTKSVQGYQ